MTSLYRGSLYRGSTVLYNARTREGEFIPFEERKGTRNCAINFCTQRVANVIPVASNVTTKRSVLYFVVKRFISGAPNENIVQNHLNIELLNVFQYLNGR